MKSKIIFISGGIRAGKSSYAAALAKKTGLSVTYIATGLKVDRETKKRIDDHIKTRPRNWFTVEEPVDLIGALNKTDRPVIIIDCLNFWLANVMPKMKDNEITEYAERFCSALKKKNAVKIIVSNEVGLSLVSNYSSGRLFQNLLGKVNQITAKHADEFYFMVSGIPVKIKPMR